MSSKQLFIDDKQLERAVKAAIGSKTVSIATLQRKLGVDYSEAAMLVWRMESAGIIASGLERKYSVAVANMEQASAKLLEARYQNRLLRFDEKKLVAEDYGKEIDRLSRVIANYRAAVVALTLLSVILLFK